MESDAESFDGDAKFWVDATKSMVKIMLAQSKPNEAIAVLRQAISVFANIINPPAPEEEEEKKAKAAKHSKRHARVTLPDEEETKNRKPEKSGENDIVLKPAEHEALPEAMWCQARLQRRLAKLHVQLLSVCFCIDFSSCSYCFWPRKNNTVCQTTERPIVLDNSSASFRHSAFEPGPALHDVFRHSSGSFRRNSNRNGISGAVMFQPDVCRRNEQC